MIKRSKKIKPWVVKYSLCNMRYSFWKDKFKVQTQPRRNSWGKTRSWIETLYYNQEGRSAYPKSLIMGSISEWSKSCINTKAECSPVDRWALFGVSWHPRARGWARQHTAESRKEGLSCLRGWAKEVQTRGRSPRTYLGSAAFWTDRARCSFQIKSKRSRN